MLNPPKAHVRQGSILLPSLIFRVLVNDLRNIATDLRNVAIDLRNVVNDMVMSLMIYVK